MTRVIFNKNMLEVREPDWPAFVRFTQITQPPEAGKVVVTGNDSLYPSPDHLRRIGEWCTAAADWMELFT